MEDFEPSGQKILLLGLANKEMLPVVSLADSELRTVSDYAPLWIKLLIQGQLKQLYWKMNPFLV